MSAMKFGMARWLLVGAIAVSVASSIEAQERGGLVRAARTEVSGIFKSAGAGTITLTILGEGRGGREGREPVQSVDKTYTLSKNAEVVVRAGSRGETNIGRGSSGGFFQEAKVTDFAAGIRVVLTLTPDQKTVESVVGEGPMIRGVIKAVDAEKKTVTVQLPSQAARERGAEAPAAEEKTYSLAPDAEISIDDGRGARFSIREAKSTDLAQGALVSVRLSVNLKQIQALHAEGPTLTGTVKAVDPAKKSLTISGGPQGRGGEAAEEQRLIVAPDAVIFLDNGKGQRLSIKPGKLADVPVGAIVTVRLAVDQSFVMFLRAEGGTLTGHLKSVDADKGIVVLTFPKGRGEAPEEKTLTLAKDARIRLDGKDAKLTDFKTGDDAPTVQVRFALDSGTVQAISANTAQRRER